MRIKPEQAIHELQSGGIVALPTETVYGLAASIHHPEAIQKVFAVKGRPSDNPLIVHISDLAQLNDYVKQLPPAFEKLAQAFWPGSLSLVLEADTKVIPDIVRAGLPTVAIRVPSHPLTLEVLAKTGPLVMPSANLSGKPSATAAQHVVDDFGDAVPVVDGGECVQGVESTILIYRNNRWVVARQGAIRIEALEEVLGYRPELHTNPDKPLCPGQLYRHYAPQATLTELDREKSGAVVGFSDREYPWASKVYLLGKSSDPEVVAHRLYDVLRQLDKDQVSAAMVDMDFPETGLWRTIRERILKAAS